MTVPRPDGPPAGSHADRGPPAAGHGHVGGPGARLRRRSARVAARRAQGVQRRQHLDPAGAPELRRHRRPGDVDLFDDDAGSHWRSRASSSPRSGEPGVRPIRTTPEPSGRSPRASGRPLRSVAHHVLAAPQDPDRALQLGGQGVRPGGDGAVPLSAEGAAVGQRGRRRRPGPAPAGVGLDVRRLHPRRLQGERPLPVGNAPPGGPAAPCCCDPAPSPCRPALRPDWRPARRRPHRAAPGPLRGPCRRRSHRRPGRRRAPSSGRPAPRSGPATTPAAGRAPADRSGASGRGAAGAVRGRRARGRHSRPRQWTASRCSGTGGPAGPTRPPGA